MELAKVCHTSAITARKPHRCVECAATINPGDRYAKTSGIWDKPAEFKQCMTCHKLFTWAEKEDYESCGEGVAFGELREWFLEFMSSGFKGDKFVKHFAEKIGCDFDDLKKFLFATEGD